MPPSAEESPPVSAAWTGAPLRPSFSGGSSRFGALWGHSGPAARAERAAGPPISIAFMDPFEERLDVIYTRDRSSAKNRLKKVPRMAGSGRSALDHRANVKLRRRDRSVARPSRQGGRVAVATRSRAMRFPLPYGADAKKCIVVTGAIAT